MPVMARRVARKPHGASQRRQKNDEDRRHEQRADPRARIQDGSPAGAASVSFADSQRGVLPALRVAGTPPCIRSQVRKAKRIILTAGFPPRLLSVLRYRT